MAFENDNGIYSLPYDGPTVDGVEDAHRRRASPGSTTPSATRFVDVSVASQSLNLWHNGKTVIGGTAGQHRHPLGADRHRHLSRLRASHLDDDERDQS